MNFEIFQESASPTYFRSPPEKIMFSKLIFVCVFYTKKRGVPVTTLPAVLINSVVLQAEVNCSDVRIDGDGCCIQASARDIRVGSEHVIGAGLQFVNSSP